MRSAKTERNRERIRTAVGQGSWPRLLAIMGLALYLVLKPLEGSMELVRRCPEAWGLPLPLRPWPGPTTRVCECPLGGLTCLCSSLWLPRNQIWGLSLLSAAFLCSFPSLACPGCPFLQRCPLPLGVSSLTVNEGQGHLSKLLLPLLPWGRVTLRAVSQGLRSGMTGGD